MTTAPFVLAFDTSAAHCAAALLLGDRLMLRTDDMARGQAEHLMPMLEEMLREEGTSWSDLDAIGVCTGPGNFTGIRIAVAAARGLALGTGLPAVGVSALEAQVQGWGGTVVSCIPAPRGAAYVQVFAGRALHPPSICQITPDALPDLHVKSEPVVVGPVAAQIAEVTNWQPVPPRMTTIEGAARLTAARYQSANARPAPLYIRAADAAPPRDPAPVLLP